MKKLKQFISCVMLSLLMASTPAGADEVDSILDILAGAGIVDPGLVDAKDLIRCLAKSSPEKCVNLQHVGKDLQSDAVSETEKQAGQFLPDDPAVRAVVDIIRAANSQDWIRVLELTGVKLLGQIACKSTLTMTGPLQPFVCGKFGAVVLDNAEPAVHEILEVLKDFPNVNVWNLISATTLDLACKIVKDSGAPFVAEACGVLGQALAAIVSLGGDLLGAIDDALTAINDFLSGGGRQMMTADEYYSRIVRPLMYKRALERLVNERQNLGMDQKEVMACFGYGGIVFGSKCPKEMSARLHKESEALVRLVQAMPESYLNTFLMDEVRKWALYRHLSGNTLSQHVNKLPVNEWAWFVGGDGIWMVGAFAGLNDGDQKYFKGLWRECGFWVNEKLYGGRTNGGPLYPELAPESLGNWICFKGAVQMFFAAMAEEDKRLTKIETGLNSLGCPSQFGKELTFTCQSHISFSVCVNQSYKDYGENRYCKADKDKTAQSLGQALVDALGDKRCRYVALSKGNFGDFEPRVQCSRPWKQQTCDALLATFRAKFEVSSSRIRMRCAYNPDKEFLAEEARAKQIVVALNGGPTAEVSPDKGRRSLPSSFDSTLCKTLWDPLAINCPHQTKMPTLTGDLATPAIESCPEDPNKNGADRVCYQVVFTHEDQLREKENQPLSPMKAPLQNPPASTIGPVRTGTVSPQPAPSPVATTGSATMLPGAAAQSVPAPPNPCRMTVNYYVPEAPVVSVISSRLLVNDQFQIQCSFRKLTRAVDWPECDDAARTSMQILKLSEEAGGRYSGIVAIDGNTVGVSSSPEDGSDFASTKTWKFDSPGAHDVSCQVDNAFRYAAEGAPTYLNSAISFDVSARSDGLTYRAYKPESASVLSVRPLPSEAVPTARDGRFRMLQDESSTNPRSGFTGVRPSRTEAAGTGATATTWNRTVLSCIIEPGNVPQYGNLKAFSEFEIWASNTSTKVVGAGQTISWRASGISASNTGFGGGGQQWTRENTYPVGTAIPIGGKLRVGRVTVPGSVSSCEMWAQ